MRDIEYLVVYIFANVVYIYTIYKFMGIFFERLRVTNKVLFGIYALAYIINTSAYILDGRPIVNFFSNMLILVFLTLFYDGTHLKRGLAVIFVYMIIMTIESGIVFISGRLESPILSTSSYSSILGLIAIKIVTYAFVMALQSFQYTKYSFTIRNAYWPFIFSIPIMSLYLLLTFYQAEMVSHPQMAIASIIFLIINFVVLYLFDKINMSFHVHLQNELYKMQANAAMKQLEIITNSQQQIREVKHDLNNHFAVIQKYLDAGDTNQVKKYLHETFKSVSESKNIINTGNLAIDSILNYKIGIAKDIGIKVNCEININREIKISDTDIVTLLGNLADNAIQATSRESGLPEKTVTIYIVYEKGLLKIRTENICTNRSIDLKSLGTSKANKENHGIGLKNVRKVVEKYNGEVDMSLSNQTFIVNVILMNQS